MSIQVSSTTTITTIAAAAAATRMALVVGRWVLSMGLELLISLVVLLELPSAMFKSLFEGLSL